MFKFWISCLKGWGNLNTAINHKQIKKMGRLYFKNKVIKEWGDARSRKAEENIKLNNRQKRFFLFFKALILLILWAALYFFHPTWFVTIILLVSIPIALAKATFVKEVEIENKYDSQTK